MPRDLRCLLCFLDDDAHADLRSDAQRLEPRHERALVQYKRTLKAVLARLDCVRQCPAHAAVDPQVAWWTDEFLNEVRRVNIDEICDPLVESYELFVGGHIQSATETLDAFLKQFGYDKRTSDRFRKSIFFRGRSGLHPREGMFHIPFSKRHCICNQRYSLSGQPLLYVGLSIVDVVSEIRGDPLNIGGYTFCYYWLREPEKIRVLDVGNELQHNILANLKGVAAGGANVQAIAAEHPSFSPAFPTYTEAFVTFILGGMCSFRRTYITPSDTFAPEYVVPQLLAHWSRTNGYDGIAYASTRVDAAKWQMAGFLKPNLYRENVAFFTTFDPRSDDEHDESLLNRFEISDVAQLSGTRPVTDAELSALTRQIIALENANPKGNIVVRSGIDLDLQFKELELHHPPGVVTRYADTECGKMQRYLQLQFLNARISDW